MSAEALAIKVDRSAIDAATKACDRLREAADRAAEAIDSLQGKSHGGIHVTMVGEAVTIEIMPVASALVGEAVVTLTGGHYSREDVRKLIEAINEMIRDGSAIFVPRV
jgi:hypothetical protein